MRAKVSSEIAVLQEIASAVVRERDVRKLLNEVIVILERTIGMSRGTFTLLEGDELRIEASARELGLSPRMMCCKLGKAGIAK